MAFDLAADLADIMRPEEFGATAAIDGIGLVAGILQNDAEFVAVGPRQQMVESNAPRFLCATRDVPGLVNGTTMRVNDVGYVVRSIRPNGFGLTELRLSEAI